MHPTVTSMTSQAVDAPKENNETIEGIATRLGEVLSSGKKKEINPVWRKLHLALVKVAQLLSIAQPELIGAVSKELQLMSKADLGHSSAGKLFREIIHRLIIEASNPDGSDAIASIKDLLGKVIHILHMEPLCDSTPEKMIDEHSDFAESNVRNMIRISKELSAPNAPYTVLSIVGAQNSGKSYLLNQLFGTDFAVMDGKCGWRRTTKGIWISRCTSPSMLIMDVEGCDGRERREDRTFENQAALYALTLSDIMIVNISNQDVARENGCSAPLFKTIFEERAKLPPGLTKILVVIRDYKNKQVPIEILREDLIKTMEQWWDEAHQNREPHVLFSKFIQVKVKALPDMDAKNFLEEVTELRTYIYNDINLGDTWNENKVPAYSFSDSSKDLWEKIKQNEKLDLPTHKVMISTIHCKRISDAAICRLNSLEGYTKLKEAESPEVFKKGFDSVLSIILAQYDDETTTYDAKVRDTERRNMEDQIKKKVTSFFQAIIQKMREDTTQQFRKNIYKTIRSIILTTGAPDCIAVVEPYKIDFLNLCQDLKSIDQQYINKIAEDLQSELVSCADYEVSRIKKEETEAAEKDRTEQQANRYDEILEETRRAMESAKKQREQEQAEIFQEMKSAQERFQQDFEKHEKERRKDEQEAAEERARQSQQFGFWSLVVAAASLLLKLFSGGGD